MRRLLGCLAFGLLGLLSACGTGAEPQARWQNPPPVEQLRLVSDGKPVPVAASVVTTTGTDAVALTFDDGPDPEYTPQLLGMLRQHGVKATFCLVGSNAQRHPELVQAIARDGHTLCNHTWSHDLRLGTRSADLIRADLQRTNDAIRQAVPGAAVPYFRHPGGKWTPAAVSVARELGMSSIGWQVDTDDWNTGGYGAGLKQHIVTVVNGQTKPGSIVLAHDGGGDRKATMAAFRELLPGLAGRFTLVALPR